MEALRWWLLLLTALMFSMSGCASHEWTIYAPQAALPSTDMTGTWRGTWVSRGMSGIPVLYKVDGVDVVARDRSGTAVKMTFTRVGDTIYGRIVGAPAPTALVLERESQ